MTAKISSIQKGSIAEELEIQAGSELLSINGVKLRDYIDYQYLPHFVFVCFVLNFSKYFFEIYSNFTKFAGLSGYLNQVKINNIKTYE